MPDLAPAAPAASGQQAANAQPIAPTQDAKVQAQESTNAQGVGAEAQPKLGDGGAAAIKKFKLKVDGKEHEVDENEVVRRAQMGTAAERRMKEAAQARAQAEEFVQKLRTDPFQVIDDPRLGLTQEQKIKAVEDWYRRTVIEPSTLTPEQRQAKEAQAKLKQYEDRDKKAAEEAQQLQLQQLEKYHAENFQKQIMEGLGTEGIPKTEYTVRRMADLMEKNMRLGLELKPSDLATLVREDYIAEQKALFANADPETILKLMDEDVVNKIRKADLARLRAGTPQLPKNPLDVAKPDADGAKPKSQWRSMDEERAERDRRVAELSKTWAKK